MWTIGGPKSRRRLEQVVLYTLGDARFVFIDIVSMQGFEGAAAFLEKDGKLKSVTKKRVGIAGMSAPARAHTEIFTADGTKKIGEVTSGGFGPTYKKPLAMGYVESAYSTEGADVAVSVRGKMIQAKITKMRPFVPTNYFKPI